MRQFVANGYTVEHDPHKINGEIVVVNTCGFIGDAQEESINMILDLGEAKKKGKIGKLFVMGCLSERFLKDLENELPEVDRFYGKFNWKELLNDLGKSYQRIGSRPRLDDSPALRLPEDRRRVRPHLFVLRHPDQHGALPVRTDGRDRE